MKILEKLKGMTEKNQIILKNVIGAFGVKGGALIVSLFTMPAYLHYFSDQQVLGVWFTVLSVLSWILNFDLGIGNGLRNNLTTAIVKKNDKAAKEYIASAYWMIGAIVIVLTIIGWIFIPLVSWNEFFNIDESIVKSFILIKVVRYTFIGIMVQFFLRLISSVLYAMQKSALINFLSLITSILQLLFVLIAPSGSVEDNLVMFAIAYVFCVNLPLFFATVIVFNGVMRSCRPHIKYVRIDKAREVISLGGIFFLCQILYMIIANTNEFFITQYTDPKFVVEYQVYNKLFTIAGTVFMLALTPVWSAVSKAVAEEDFLWLDKLNRIMMLVSIVAVVLEFMIIPFLQIIVDIWLRENTIQINYWYAFWFALFGAAMIYQSTVSTIANGTGRMKTQAFCYAIGIIAKMLIIHVGINIMGEWIIVVMANAVILIPYCIVQQFDIHKYIKSKI